MAVVQITSPEHLQEQLGADLNRLSILSFRAEWAEPCKQMDEVVRELAKKYQQALFLEIEAESLPDISESFEVESVPFFILLRGHTLLEQIQGAQATALSAAVDKHANKKTVAPLSRTDQKPEAPPTTFTPAAKTNGSAAPPTQPAAEPVTRDAIDESPEALDTRCQELMNKSPVVLFMKGDVNVPRCGFSQKIVKLLKENEVEFTTHDILQDEAARQRLKEINEWPTFPQLIIGGEFVGGLDVVVEMAGNGELKELVEGASA